jgi:glycolate oxidase iron-sulfur subunit
MSPRLLHLVGRSLWLYQASGLNAAFRKLKLTRLLPKRLAELEPTTPTIKPQFSAQLIDNWEYPRGGTPKYRVGFLTGCVQDLVFSDVNRDTVDVLLANECAVFTPRHQSCCGSLHAHNGEIELAKELAKRQIDTFDLDSLDGIISNAGGCGSHLKGYGALLKDDPDYGERARQWDAKLFDIHEWLDRIGWRQPKAELDMELTYHDSCHLCHGQKIARQPREILRGIPGLRLRELPEASWCCGSAGIYNITQPEQAEKLQRRKMANIERTGCDRVATANPGCHLQLENGFKLVGQEGTVKHPVSILAEAYRQER